jgi:uncharacterized protein DUF4238
MPKNKHHFVPRFYLSAFQSAPKRINVLGVDTSVEVQDASLRDQCYQRKFYGKDNRIEDALAIMEGHAARVLNSIQSTGTLPPEGTDEHVTLLAFVAFQLLRTTIVAKRVNTVIDKTTKQAHSRDPRFTDRQLDTVQFGFDDPVIFALGNIEQMVVAISDLGSHLAVSSESVFITSDNPAFKYNQYCEDINYQGITGALCRGFQIFFPLTPKLCLVLYDRDVYSVPRAERRSRVSAASDSDIEFLNGMQLLSSDRNVYFSEWQARQQIRELLGRVRQHRDSDPTVVQEYGHDTDPNRSLLHAFERTPCLKLRLSFFKVRWRARSVSLSDRVRGYRKEIPMPGIPEPPDRYRGPATFSRFIGKR